VNPTEVDDWGFDEISLPAPSTAAGRRRPPERPPAPAPVAVEEPEPPRELVQLTIDDGVGDDHLAFDDTAVPLEPAIEEPGDEWAVAAQPERRPATHGVARNTAIFSILTGASRIMGLIREIVAAYFFGTSGRISAFTLAFQVPNLVRGLFADAEVRKTFLAPQFFEPLVDTPAELAGFLDAEAKKWGKVIRDAKIKVE